MIALGWVTNIFQRGAASMGRLNYILTAEPNICDENSQVPHSAAGNAASFRAKQEAPRQSASPKTPATPAVHSTAKSSFAI
jgi:hypothetical protein